MYGYICNVLFAQGQRPRKVANRNVMYISSPHLPANLGRGPEACSHNELQVSYDGPHKSPHPNPFSIRGRSEAHVRHASVGSSEEAHHCTGEGQGKGMGEG